MKSSKSLNTESSEFITAKGSAADSGDEFESHDCFHCEFDDGQASAKFTNTPVKSKDEEARQQVRESVIINLPQTVTSRRNANDVKERNEIFDREAMKEVYCVKRDMYSLEEIQDLLFKIQEGKVQHPILSLPPSRVKGGHVYIYELGKKNDRDYVKDQLTGLAQFRHIVLNKVVHKAVYKKKPA
jgi:hypothetical protein